MHSKNKDWGYFDETDTNCDDCKEKCIEDETCESVECGNGNCRWWKNGKCNENHQLTISKDGQLLTCLKETIGIISINPPSIIT